jgi:hypothetical protein
MVEGYVKCVVAKQTKSNSAPLPNLLNLGKRVIYGHHAKEVVVLMGLYLGQSHSNKSMFIFQEMWNLPI